MKQIKLPSLIYYLWITLDSLLNFISSLCCTSCFTILTYSQFQFAQAWAQLRKMFSLSQSKPNQTPLHHILHLSIIFWREYIPVLGGYLILLITGGSVFFLFWVIPNRRTAGFGFLKGKQSQRIMGSGLGFRVYTSKNYLPVFKILWAVLWLFEFHFLRTVLNLSELGIWFFWEPW